MKPITIAILLALTCLGSARAQTLAEIDKREASVVEAWEKTPLTMRRAIFVKTKAPLYGQFDDRGSNVFKPGEPILVYAEPIGYGWRAAGDSYEFGVTADFKVKRPDGRILGGQDKFLNASFHSHYKLRELMVNLTLSLSDFPAGDYVLEYTLHDITSDKQASFSLPFTISG